MPKSATRVLRILEFIAEHQQGCTHTEIANALDIPKASLSALLSTVKEEGYVSQDPKTGRLTVGIQILSLANAYLRNLNLARMGAPVVSGLFSEVGLFAVLAVPQDTEYVIICAESRPALLTHSLQIGHRGPLFCSAVGRAILAHLPEKEVDRILDHSDLRPITSKTLFEPLDIKAALQVVRDQGIAISDGESIEDILGICAPVFDWSGRPVAALGVAAAVNLFDSATLNSASSSVKAAAVGLSHRLGNAAAAGGR